MSIPGWQASQGRTSQNGEVTGPFTGQMKPDELSPWIGPAGCVGVAGSTILEDDIVLAGQVGVAGHLRLGEGVRATAQTGIPSSVKAGEFVSGTPAISHQEWLKSSAVYRQLPALRKRLAELERRTAELEEKLEACRTLLDG